MKNQIIESPKDAIVALVLIYGKVFLTSSPRFRIFGL